MLNTIMDVEMHTSIHKTVNANRGERRQKTNANRKMIQNILNTNLQYNTMLSHQFYRKFKLLGK